MTLPRRDAAHWWDFARCRRIDEKVFFPPPNDRSSLRYAKAICDGCPVLDYCREWVLDLESQQRQSHEGVVAGMSPRQRRQAINDRAQSAADIAGADRITAPVDEQPPGVPQATPSDSDPSERRTA